MTFEEERWNAIRNASLRNERENPAVQAEYRPEQFTPEMERELVEKVHGTEAERIDRLVAEFNEAQRKR